MISERISDDIPPQKNILNVHILMHLKLKCFKSHNPTKCDAIDDVKIICDSISQDILSQIFIWGGISQNILSQIFDVQFFYKSECIRITSIHCVCEQRRLWRVCA